MSDTRCFDFGLARSTRRFGVLIPVVCSMSDRFIIGYTHTLASVESELAETQAVSGQLRLY